jgi:hypothetical protein
MGQKVGDYNELDIESDRWYRSDDFSDLQLLETFR